ncbi:MAG: alginate lyase family protein, partial [Methylococcales bacterium]|nr:alginate lyase family protein [Methylococcales bacterium]
MRIHHTIIATFVLGLCATHPVSAQVSDVELRREALRSMDARALCVGPRLDSDLLLQPIAGLGATEGYGSDNRSADFAWAVMVWGGASLMGDESAKKSLIEILTLWASADALLDTAPIHDAHFALKRTLLPVISNYSIIREEISPESRGMIDRWLGQLVALIDHKFDADVDSNNHRYLADSVLAAWGALTGNERLLDKAEARLRHALNVQMRVDGSFPLEARRGARALWYTRQTMASLTSIISSLDYAGRAPLEAPDLLRNYEMGLSYLL